MVKEAKETWFVEKWKELPNPPVLTWLFARRLVNFPPDSLTIRSICSCSLSKLLLRNLSSSRSLSFLWINPHNLGTSWNTNWLINTTGHCDNIVLANSAPGFVDKTTNNKVLLTMTVFNTAGEDPWQRFTSANAVSGTVKISVKVSHKTKILLVY